MDLDELRRFQPDRAGGFGEVGTELSAIANGDSHQAWFAKTPCFVLVIIGAQRGLDGSVIDNAWVESHHK